MTVQPKGLDHAASLLPALLARMTRRIGDATLLRPVWATVVGETIAASSHPRSWNGDTLVIVVEPGSWRGELERRADELQERLAGVLGDLAPTALRFTTEAELEGPSEAGRPARSARRW